MAQRSESPLFTVYNNTQRTSNKASPQSLSLICFDFSITDYRKNMTVGEEELSSSPEMWDNHTLHVTKQKK